MNIERYTMPVIIAAALHGALWLSFSDKGIVPPHDRGEKPVDLPPLVDQLAMLPDDPGEAGDGQMFGDADPLPKLPDLPEALRNEDIFTVRVTEHLTPLNPVGKLPREMGSLTGPGDGLRGAPAIPDFRSLDRFPRATMRPVPLYPDNMRRSATSGSVTVQFVVDTTGRVVTAEAVSWTHRDFVDPAVSAVLRWRFEPGTLNGRKVSFRMAVPIEFNATL